MKSEEIFEVYEQVKTSTLLVCWFFLIPYLCKILFVNRLIKACPYGFDGSQPL